MSKLLVMVPRPERGTYRLLNKVPLGVAGKLTFEVPKGFETDGASIPRFAWITTGTPFDPKHIRAAVLHDFMYQAGIVERKAADDLFRQMLREDGVGGYQAGKMYFALRIFGRIAWHRYRKQRQGGENARVRVSGNPRRDQEPGSRKL